MWIIFERSILDIEMKTRSVEISNHYRKIFSYFETNLLLNQYKRTTLTTNLTKTFNEVVHFTFEERKREREGDREKRYEVCSKIFLTSLIIYKCIGL